MIDLKFENVSKRYRIFKESETDGKRNILGRLSRRLRRGNWNDFWALRDVSFDVNRGEALGLIGQNGAGKSTILKLLYNITTPTKGLIRVNGRLSALIEVASGFHPDLTGRENVYLNGSLLGMKRAEIRSKLDRIVEFAGVSAFIDTAVKRYSSGMYLRLGFSIAAHLDPDILLLDEVLAVGDAEFQSRCLERISQLRRAGTTIVFVSHNLGAIENLCDRVFLLRHGEIFRSGAPRYVISEYEHMLTSMPAATAKGLMDVHDAPAAEIVSVIFYNSEGRRTTMFATGDAARVEVELMVHEPVEDALVEVYFYSIFGNIHSHFSTEVDGPTLALQPGRCIVEFDCPQLPFEVAAFNIESGIKLRGSSFNEHVDYKRTGSINITRGKPVHGAFHTPHSWSVRSVGLPDRDHDTPAIVRNVD
jgi:ABC-type polysaccharide/polyol phosphate transport system ATPase subunit